MGPGIWQSEPSRWSSLSIMCQKDDDRFTHPTLPTWLHMLPRFIYPLTFIDIASGTHQHAFPTSVDEMHPWNFLMHHQTWDTQVKKQIGRVATLMLIYGYLMFLFWHPATGWWGSLFWSFFVQSIIACKPLARSSLNSPSKRLPSLARWMSMRVEHLMQRRNHWCKIKGKDIFQDKCRFIESDPSKASVFSSIATLAAPHFDFVMPNS